MVAGLEVCRLDEKLRVQFCGMWVLEGNKTETDMDNAEISRVLNIKRTVKSGEHLIRQLLESINTAFTHFTSYNYDRRHAINLFSSFFTSLQIWIPGDCQERQRPQLYNVGFYNPQC